MKKIMIIGASILQLPAILKAKEMGFQVIAVDMDRKALGFQYADVCLPISTIDTPNVVQAAVEYQVDGVMTLASDMPMQTVAAVAKELDICGVDEQTSINATNKVEMRKSLRNHQVPIPQSFKASNEEEYFQAVSQFQGANQTNGAYIVKPADNSGSRGIYLLNDKSDQKTIRDAYYFSREYSRNGDVLIEEYMEGPEVSVETLSVGGECHIIQITDKLTTGSPHFVEMGHSEPSMLSTEIQEQISAVAIAAVNAIGIIDGPSHTEIKVTRDGPKIVEIGARLGGDNITTHLVPLSNGVNMVECCIRIAVGDVPDMVPKFKKASAIRYIKAPLGTITEISGVEKAEQISGVQQVSIVHGVGEQSSEIHGSGDRVGFVIAQADTPKQAIKICEDALEEVKVLVEIK